MEPFLQQIAKVNFERDATRLIHGRGGCYKGAEHLNLDWYPPVVLLTSFKELTADKLAQLQDAVTERWQQLSPKEPLNLVYQFRCGGQTATELLTGSVPEKHLVTENGAYYHVHLMRGQNHGLFLDMKQGRQWVRENAREKQVLNLFAYTCGFSIAALQGGANGVVNIDMSKGALAIGQRNHLVNELTNGARFLAHDIFKSWGKLKKLGPYDMIIADPPSNQKGSFVATKDYARLLRRLPQLLAEQGELLLCLNAPQLPLSFLTEQVSECCPELTLVEQIANPKVFHDVDPDRALKVLRYRS